MLKAAHQTNFGLQMIRFRSAKSGPNPFKLADSAPIMLLPILARTVLNL